MFGSTCSYQQTGDIILWFLCAKCDIILVLRTRSNITYLPILHVMHHLFCIPVVCGVSSIIWTYVSPKQGEGAAQTETSNVKSLNWNLSPRQSSHSDRHINDSNLKYISTEATTNVPNSDGAVVSPTVNKHKSPTIYLNNPRSLNNKFDEFRTTLLDYEFDIAAISGTWFSIKKLLTYYEIEGYNLYSRSRTVQKGGGVGLYVNENLNSSII